MIKINKKDSIIDIIIKISNCKEKEITLDIPFAHPILHNSTSLKILKNKAWNKELIIITNDKTSKNILKNLWIRYTQDKNENLLEYNYSFWEYTKYLIKSYILEFFQIFSSKTGSIKSEYKLKNPSNSKIWIFLLVVILSLFLFLFVFYFAVNKTYIEITPEISIKTKAKNFVFREVNKDEIPSSNVIKLKKVSKNVIFSNTYGTSWIDKTKIKHSKWKVKFYNHLAEKVELLWNTRLQSINWVLFTTDTPVKIPPAEVTSDWKIIPWTKLISITSVLHNVNWEVVWDKANLKRNEFLELPGLTNHKDKIYAKTYSKISWANNNIVKQLTKQDIENAKKALELSLKQQAIDELKQQIIDDNNLNNIDYKILWVDDIIEYSEFNIIWLDKIKPWENIDNFELSWTIKITSYTYNTKKLLSELSSSIKWHVLEEVEKILYLNDKSLRVANIISKEKEPLEIKATVWIEVFYIHNFSWSRNSYINKLKNSISWLDKDVANKVLLNNSRISDVSIEIRPFFVDKVSKINDNIIIDILER